MRSLSLEVSRLSRRQLIIAAAACIAAPTRADEADPARAGIEEWRGSALGAEAKIMLRGTTPQRAARVFAKVERVLRTVEGRFSLYRDSELTRLNRIGRLAYPSPAMQHVIRVCGEVHKATNGLFDPTIQPLWLAVANAGDTAAARTLLGWQRVRFSEAEIALEPGMQLTFNGIAQGHAADEVAQMLSSEGFDNVLVDSGELVGLGSRPDGESWMAAIDLPDGREVARIALANRALAVSSPLGTRIGGKPHILNPGGGDPLWQLAAVSAPSAALADALSTVFCLMARPAIEAALAKFPGARLEALT
jgi:thiamine biosynthesis lipoprotein